MVQWLLDYWVYITLGLILLIFLLVLWLIKRSADPKVNARKVGGTLRRFASLRQYAVLENVNLTHGEETAHFDYALVSFFGVLWFSVIGDVAAIYGQAKDQKWTIVDKDKRRTIPNPVATGEKAMETVRKVFAENKIYNTKMEHFVVFAGGGKKTEIYVTAPEQAVKRADLVKLIGSSKYDKDNDLDVKTLAAFLKEQSGASEK